MYVRQHIIAQLSMHVGVFTNSSTSKKLCNVVTWLAFTRTFLYKPHKGVCSIFFAGNEVCGWFTLLSEKTAKF